MPGTVDVDAEDRLAADDRGQSQFFTDLPMIR